MSVPLFSPRSSAPLGSLRLRRFDPEGQRWLSIPRVFRSDELPDRDALKALFGGGRYEVIGRDARGQRIAARACFVLEGEALPIDAATLGAPPSLKTHAAMPGSSLSGAIAARVFALFDQGHNLSQIVVATHIDPRSVRALYREWITPLGQDVPSAAGDVARLERAALESMMGGES
jgi:hypothetical protein